MLLLLLLVRSSPSPLAPPPMDRRGRAKNAAVASSPAAATAVPPAWVRSRPARWVQRRRGAAATRTERDAAARYARRRGLARRRLVARVAAAAAVATAAGAWRRTPRPTPRPSAAAVSPGGERRWPASRRHARWVLHGGARMHGEQLARRRPDARTARCAGGGAGDSRPPVTLPARVWARRCRATHWPVLQ